MPYFRFKSHSYFWLVLITYIICFLDDTIKTNLNRQYRSHPDCSVNGTTRHTEKRQLNLRLTGFEPTALYRAVGSNPVNLRLSCLFSESNQYLDIHSDYSAFTIPCVLSVRNTNVGNLLHRRRDLRAG